MRGKDVCVKDVRVKDVPVEDYSQAPASAGAGVARGATDRRDLLRLALASATTLWLPRSAWSQPRLGTSPFTLGVASGTPEPESVVLWTRLSGVGSQPVTLRWEIARDEQFRRIAQQGQVQALPEFAHAVHVEAGGLHPDRRYFYRFMLGAAGQDWVSAVGQTRTAPHPDAEVARLRVAYASCQRWEHGFYAAYRQMREDAPDLVLFLGDYIYEYPNPANNSGVRRSNGGWVLTLDDYRDRYAVHRSDVHLQAMHAACPWLVTWDDHEVQNDYAGLRRGDSGPMVEDFAARRAAAYQAFWEHMPLRASVLTQSLAGLSRGAEMRIHASTRWGRLAQLHMLDARQYKDPQVCNKDDHPGSSMRDPQTCPEWDEPRRTLLGVAQERWLDDTLARSDARWNLIGQQSIFGPREYRRNGARSVWNDGWDGYSAARRRLTDVLGRERQRRGDFNAVFFGGDVHEHWVGHVKADYARADSAAVATEFCGTSISTRSGGRNERVAPMLAAHPHFVFGDVEKRGYGLAEFSRERLRTTLRGVDDATREDSAVPVLARFEVRSGTPQVERI